MRNAKELYDTLISMPDLHSIPEIHDDILIWPLYRDAYICACCNDSAYIEIVSNSLYAGTLVHRKLSQDKMLERLYALGKKGNILVLKKTLFGTNVFYTGPADEYAQSGENGIHFGNKKYDSGQLICLEQK